MRSIRLAAHVSAVGVTLALIPVVHRSPQATYGGADPRVLTLEVAAALALVLIAGLSPPSASAVLVALVGLLWLVPETAGASGVPLSLRALADALGPMVVALLVMAVVLRAGTRAPQQRAPLVMALAGVMVAAVARVLLVDPFLDPECWRTCQHNPLLIAEGRWGGYVELVGLVGLAAGCVWSAAAHFTGPARDRWWEPDVAGWVAVASLLAAYLVRSSGISLPVEYAIATALVVVAQAAVLGWLATNLWESWRRWRLGARLTQFVDLLRTGWDPESLANSLRRAVSEPGLQLAYWAPARQAYVDATGRVAKTPAPGPNERATRVTRNGQTIATIVHSGRVNGRRLEQALSPALLLAVENAQLHAAAMAELSELTNSRIRVVNRTELERQRLERNLHDGAQQRVVSLALLVRRLAGRAASVDQETAARAEVLTRTLVEELRRVARGIYPAVLADAGLIGGVLDLAESSEDLPVAVGDFPDSRYPGAVETTAYLLVSAWILDARTRGARGVTIAGEDAGATLRVMVMDDAGSPPSAPAPELMDQVGALGGTLLTNGHPGHHRMEVVLPCVS